jgi:hypothetical protein
MRWFNARAWHYDTLRQLMSDGKVDLDFADTGLRDELINQTYKFSAKGAVQITSKDEMKKMGLSSPDSLDAAILSVVDFTDTFVPQAGQVIELDIPEAEHSFYSESYW